LRLGLALLQKLDRYAVGRADERHTAVPGRPVDRHARLHQAIAGGVDVVDLVGEVAEVAAGAVRLRIPIVRQLNKRRTLRLGPRLVLRSREENEREAAGLVLDPAHLLETQLAAVEIQTLLDVADSH